MLRLSRRLTTALLWIAIALLPVRAWAALMMPMAMGHTQSAEMTSAAAAASTLPCHAAVQSAADDGSTTPSTCSMCDLCHTTVAQVAHTVLTPPHLHEALPRAAASAAIEPRAPDGLFRPPRTLLA
jgi:hypothetical protein